MSQTLLELREIKKYFPTRRGILRNTVGFVKAVDGVNLKILEGQNLGLVGESGCGKTTLARIILKLIKPDCGRLIVNGEDITDSYDVKQNFRKNIQMVFQDPFSSLDPRFRVADIVGEAAGLLKEKRKSKILDKVSETLSAVGLSKDSLSKFPHEFSGGERQRIAIARAIFAYPKLLIFDEAVSSLDILIQNQILNLLLKLKKELSLTYVFISHNLRVIKRIGQQIAVMYMGRIVELAETEEIFNSAMHPYTKLLLNASVEFKADARDEKLVSLSSHGCSYSDRCAYKKEICLCQSPDLKEISQGHFVACHFVGEDK